MSTEENKALVRRWYEAHNQGKVGIAAIDELCASSCILHSSSDRDFTVEEYQKYADQLLSGFPDAHQTIDDMIAEGDKVVVRFTLTGTHTGEYMGVPPTNKKMTAWLIQIFRIAGGKIVEGWSRSDTLGMMQQLGVIPTPKKEK